MMKLVLIIASALFSVANGARYGLLRVGAAFTASSPATMDSGSKQRSLFEEDFSLAFRQLFGYKAGLCMSAMAAPLSMSMAQAQLSMSMAMAPLSLSMGAGMSFGGGAVYPASGFVDSSESGTTSSGTSPEAGASSGQLSDKSTGNDSSAKSRNGMGAGAASVVAVVAAVGLVAAVFAKNRQNAASAAGSASVGSFQP